MDRDRIEKKAELYVNEHGLTDAGDLADFAEHIAAIARAEALEEAAMICIVKCTSSCDESAMQIRALKELK
jgi:hypothetical protein